MVRALLAGRKTQTRRLISSPLTKCVVGDRLWVREAWKAPAIHDKTKPSDLDPATSIYFTADDRLWPVARYRPGMHMPRWASRLTLTITDVRRTEKVDQISRSDAIAEGIYQPNADRWTHDAGTTMDWSGDPVTAFGNLWDSLHDKPGERFAESPHIVALTFRVTLANIDASDHADG